MLMKRTALVLVALLMVQAAAIAQPAKTLDIYFIDVEGGQATLIVPVEKGGKVTTPYDAYASVRRKGAHLEPKVGEMLPLKEIAVEVVSGKNKTLTEPLSGAGQDNPACTTFKKKVNDFTENGRSLGFRLTFGKFTFVDLGDLVWNELGQLVCPKNMLGEADVYLVAHHGNAFAAVPAVVAALHPRVAIINNGENKGGDPKTFKTLQNVPGLESLWQLHRSGLKGATKQAPDEYIANLDEKTAHRIKLTASEDGSFTVTNGRTGMTKRYAAK
jgi:competence protein ComEC